MTPETSALYAVRPASETDPRHADALYDAMLLFGWKERKCTEVEGAGLSRYQFLVLQFVSSFDRACITTVADYLVVSLPTASRIVDTLVAAGWVGRVRDTVDKRKTLLVPTEAGSEVLERRREEISADLAECAALLDEEERGVLARVAGLIKHRLVKQLSLLVLLSNAVTAAVDLDLDQLVGWVAGEGCFMV